MAKSKKQKEDTLAQLKEKIAEAKTIVFVDYTGMNVEGATNLREKAKEEGAEYLVAKKTLLGMALDDAGYSDVQKDALQGNIGILFGYEDEVAPARIAKDFTKKFETFAIRAGVMEGNFLAQESVEQLAALPSKEELLAKVVGSLNAPVSGFVNVLAGNMRGLVLALNAIAEQKQSA